MSNDRLPLIDSIVRVGGGRGFVIEANHDTLIITAAHCLPHLPPAASTSFIVERTFANIIGPLGESPSVWAECLFVDPVADLAVLASPDNQELSDEAAAYDALVEPRVKMPIGTVPLIRSSCELPRFPGDGGEPLTILLPAKWEGQAWLLSIENQWFSATINATFRCLWIGSAAERIRGGMSGSPIVALDGSAIGVLCTSAGGGREGGPNPFLWQQLPRWIVEDK